MSLAVSAHFLFTAGEGVPLVARSLATGDTAWTNPLLAWKSLAAADDLVLGVTGDHAYALEAATGRTRWVAQTTGANTRLTIVDGRLLMASDSDILVRDTASGTPLWNAALPSPPSTAPSADAESVVVGLTGGTVMSFALATGTPRWTRTLDATPRTLTVRAPHVYTALEGPAGFFCALDAGDGRIRWCPELRVPMAGQPVIVDRLVFVALLDNTLRAYNRQNGAMRQPSPLGHRPAMGPRLSDASLIVPLTTGEFVVFDPEGRVLARIGSPASAVTPVLERAAIGPGGRALASLTISPGGGRRLTVYNKTIGALATPTALPALPGTLTTLPPPPPAQRSKPAPARPARQDVPVNPAEPRSPGPAPSPFPRPR
jgi:outer membrane protein assembly factor BamB